MILRSLAEFAVVLLAGGFLVVFGRRVTSGRSEFTSGRQKSPDTTPEAWTAFNEQAGTIVQICGAGMVATTVIMMILWLATRSEFVIAGNWLIAAGWIIGLGIAATRAAKIAEPGQ